MRGSPRKRKEAGRLRKQQKRRAKTKRLIVSVASTTVVSIGLIASVLGVYAYKSRLSVSPENAPVTVNSLSMPIRVSNDGMLSVYDVRFVCMYKHVEFDKGSFTNMTISGFPTQNVPEITPSHPVTVVCAGAPNRAAAIKPPANSQITGIELEIIVSFRPSFYPWRKNEGFEFTGVRAPDGTFRWMPH